VLAGAAGAKAPPPVPAEFAARGALADSPSREPMLGISFRNAGGTLAWFDPLTLTTLRGRKAPLATYTGTWAFSEDRAAVVFGSWELSRLRFVNARTMRVTGGLSLTRGAGGIRAIAWPRPDRLLAILSDAPTPVLAVIDPQSRRVLRRVPLAGAVYGIQRLSDGLAFLLGEDDSFAPARVATADAEGTIRTVTVSRVRVGTVVDQDGGGYHARTMSPGFAVDPEGRRAFLVAADSTVAEVDLDKLGVAYHELDHPSFFGRLSHWLVPTASAKEVEGPTRQARWLGSGLIAVGGLDYSLTKGPDGKERQIAKPAGVTLVDTSSWRTRTLDAEASEFSVAGDLVIASGGSYDSAEAEADIRGIGIVAYGLDGRERWRLHPGERRWLNPVCALGYVYLDGNRMEVVDLATGAVVKQLERHSEPWPSLLADRASIP